MPPIEREVYLLMAEQEAQAEQTKNKPKDMILGTPIDPTANPLNGLNN